MSVSHTLLRFRGMLSAFAFAALLSSTGGAFAETVASSAEGGKKAAKLPLVFEGLSKEEAREAREVYRRTRERFIELTGRKVGALTVRVRFVERPSGGEAVRTITQRMGVTVQNRGECRISIRRLRRGSFGRVLAHELVHAFLHEAYGRVENRALSEGFAEYLASFDHSAEVNHDMRSASARYVNAPKIQPYVEGYNFCLHYARAPGFVAFFDRQIYTPDFGFETLMTLWRQAQRAPRSSSCEETVLDGDCANPR